MEDLIGTVLDDRYEIAALIATGGFGTIYRAHHKIMGNDVAIKILHPRYAADPEGMKRFHREARIISELRHQNIFSVYAFGNVNGLVYMATELLAGESLGTIVRERGPMPADKALPVFIQICDAMAFAHANGVFHRDLKPDNVIVTTAADGTWTAKLIDFGLAKLLDGPEGQRLTKTGEVLGDPNYMSPEQAQGQRLDHRSDIYSFGCLMYEVLTGEPPFAAESPVAVLMKQISQQPEPFAQRLGLPPSLEAIVFTCLVKDRELRYESFAAVKETIGKFVADPSLQIKAPAKSHGGTRQGKRWTRATMAVLFVVGMSGVVSVALVVAHMNDIHRQEAQEMEQISDREDLRSFDRNVNTFPSSRRRSYSLAELQHIAEVARRLKRYDSYKEAERAKFELLSQIGDYKRALDLALVDVKPTISGKDGADADITQEIGNEGATAIFEAIANSSIILGRPALAEKYLQRMLEVRQSDADRRFRWCSIGPNLALAKRELGKREEARKVMRKVVDEIRQIQLIEPDNIRLALFECMALEMNEETAALSEQEHRLATGGNLKVRHYSYLDLYRICSAKGSTKPMENLIAELMSSPTVSDADKMMVLAGLANVCFKMKRFDLSQLVCDKMNSLESKVRKTDPSHAEMASFVKVTMLAEQKNHEEAAREARTLVERLIPLTSGTDDWALRWAWQAYLKEMDLMGKTDDARALQRRVGERLQAAARARDNLKYRRELFDYAYP